MISLGNIYPKTDKNNSDAKNGTRPPKNDLPKLLISFGVLVTLVIFLVLIFKYDSKNKTNKLPIANQPEEILLNPKEVEAERLLLPLYKAVDSVPTSNKDGYLGATNNTSPTVSILTESDVSNILSKANETNFDKKSEKFDEVSVTQPSSPTTKVESTANVYIEPESGVRVKDISVTYANAEQNLSNQKRKGTLQTINLAENFLLIVDSNSVIKINITPQTNVFINKKKIAVTDLLLGDILLVEGSGYATVTELTAKDISIIAKLQFITDSK